MTYWGEFRTGWRPLAAAALGLGSGFSTTGVVTSIMAPHMIGDLHWTTATFAKVGAVSILMSLVIPVAGRLADVWGVRRTAAIGVIALPLCMIALSRMTGAIAQYYTIFIVQSIFCVTTTSTVFSRVVVGSFQQARGLALAMAASAPGVTGILAGLLLNPFVDAHGWRAGYLVTATIALICGGIAIWLLPPRRREIATLAKADAAETTLPPSRRCDWSDYSVIFRARAFWTLIVAMILCNLYQTLVLTQLSLLILSKGIDKVEVGTIVSAFSVSMVIGRFCCGGAIDRLPAQFVAVVGMGLPCLGLFLLASGLNSLAAVTVAMILIGVAVGAEGDLIGVLVSRAFGIAIYGSVMGLVTASVSLATASGALLLGVMLQHDAAYRPFLLVTGTSTLIGSLLFLLLPRSATAVPRQAGEPHPVKA